MSEKLVICMFASVCRNNNKCSHAHSHYQSHTRDKSCAGTKSVCCDYSSMINRRIKMETVGEIVGVNPFDVKYPRCIDYDYWRKAIKDGADIVLKDFTLSEVDGSITQGLKDGYRSTDFSRNVRTRNHFAFLGSPDEGEANRRDEPPVIRHRVELGRMAEVDIEEWDLDEEGEWDAEEDIGL